MSIPLGNKGNKDSSVGLRVPEVYNSFLEKTVADTQNKKSAFVLAGSVLLSSARTYLDNEKSWKTTFEGTKKAKKFDRDVKIISESSDLFVDLEPVEKAGISQEELNCVFSAFSKLAKYAKTQKIELDEKLKEKQC